MNHQKTSLHPHRLRHNRRRAGFTLVEILAVIAIISLLIAILLPAMAAARRSSKRTICQSNLRQLAAGWHMYLDQHDGHFFQKPNANVNFGGRQGRGSQLFGANPNRPVAKPLNPYVSVPPVTTVGADVFKCPADTGGGLIGITLFEFYGTSYVTNLMLIGQNQLFVDTQDPCRDVWEAVNLRIGDMRRSRISTSEAKLVLMGDSGWRLALSPTDSERVEWHDKPYSHNLAFMDGHVEFLRIRKGLHVTDQYTVMPFADLASQTAQCQQEVPTP